jgi:hypothetical protein
MLRMADSPAAPKWNDEYLPAKPYADSARKLHSPAADSSR